MANKSGVPGALRRKIFRRDNYTCADCGLVGFEVKTRSGYGHHTSIAGVYLSIDHKHPRSLGGTNDEDNLRTVCTRCNTIKGVGPMKGA